MITMQRPASAAELGRPRSLVVQRGSRQSSSSPALAAAFNLRKYAVKVKHIASDRPASAPAMGMGNKVAPITPEQLTRIDLIGGNGKWRQLLAEEEFKRRKAASEEKRRQELTKAKEKMRRDAETTERKRRHQAEEERRWREEAEQQERDRLEKERIKQEQEDRERQRREFEEEERKKRMPKTCETCNGTAKCQDCGGKGFLFHMYLVSNKGMDYDAGGTEVEHGRKEQGCEKCGGCAHNLLGDIKMGTGECAVCQGLGKIWPVIEDTAISPKSKGFSQAWQFDRSQDARITA